MDLLEEVSLFMTRKRSSTMVADDIHLESLDATMLGIVFGVPALIGHLDQFLHRPGGRQFIAGHVAELADTSATDYRTLRSEGHVMGIGDDLIDLILADRRRVVSELVAKRAGITAAQAEALLTALAPVLLICLARREPARGAGGFNATLNTEVAKLRAGGWGTWFAEVTAPEIGATRGRAEPSPTSLSVEPARRRRPPVPPPGPPTRPDPGHGSQPPGLTPVSGDSIDEAAWASEPSSTDRLRRLAVPVLAIIALFGLAAWLLPRSDGSPDTALSSVEGVSSSGDQEQEAGADEDDEADDPSDTTPEALDGQTGPTPVDEVDTDGLARIDISLADPLGRLDGTGFARLTLDRDTGEVCYDFDIQGVASPYDGHIHVGPAGVKGGIVVDFGELSGPTSGCLDNRPIDTSAILDDLAGHYIEFHDADQVNTVRAQLTEAEMIEGATVDQDDDAEERGAVIVISDGALTLQGEVPDQVAIDKMVESFADIDLGSTELINQLTIVAGAPRPSGRIVVDDTVLFDINSDQLAAGASTVLDDLATILRARPAWSATVVGHTDSTGSEVYNLELSLRRAESVRVALIAAGVPDDVLTIRGAGSTAHVGDNATPEGRRQNRRIELEVIAG